MKKPDYVLRSALLNSQPVAALVAERVHPVMAPGSPTLPFVVYRRISIQRSQSLGGPLGLPRLSVEFNIYGATYDSARQVADAVRACLDGYGGSLENTTVEQTSLESESDDFVSLAGAELPAVYAITQTYDVWYQES